MTYDRRPTRPRQPAAPPPVTRPSFPAASAGRPTRCRRAQRAPRNRARRALVLAILRDSVVLLSPLRDLLGARGRTGRQRRAGRPSAASAAHASETGAFVRQDPGHRRPRARLRFVNKGPGLGGAQDRRAAAGHHRTPRRGRCSRRCAAPTWPTSTPARPPSACRRAEPAGAWGMGCRSVARGGHAPDLRSAGCGGACVGDQAMGASTRRRGPVGNPLDSLGAPLVGGDRAGLRPLQPLPRHPPQQGAEQQVAATVASTQPSQKPATDGAPAATGRGSSASSRPTARCPEADGVQQHRQQRHLGRAGRGRPPSAGRRSPGRSTGRAPAPAPPPAPPGRWWTAPPSGSRSSHSRMPSTASPPARPMPSHSR